MVETEINKFSRNVFAYMKWKWHSNNKIIKVKKIWKNIRNARDMIRIWNAAFASEIWIFWNGWNEDGYKVLNVSESKIKSEWREINKKIFLHHNESFVEPFRVEIFHQCLHSSRRRMNFNVSFWMICLRPSHIQNNYLIRTEIFQSNHISLKNGNRILYITEPFSSKNIRICITFRFRNRRINGQTFCLRDKNERRRFECVYATLFASKPN